MLESFVNGVGAGIGFTLVVLTSVAVFTLLTDYYWKREG